MESLGSIPANKYAPVLNDANCSNLASVGFLPFSQTLKHCPWREKIDNDWLRFCTDKKIEYDSNAFHVASSSHERVNKASLKYDKLYPESIPIEEFRIALRDLLNFFDVLKDECPILDFDDVKVTPDSVSGLVFEKWFALKKKKDAAKEFPYIKNFWDQAHLENHPWLWKQAGKVELLKLSKLLNDDIRCFTIIPFEAFMYTARMFQSMNEKMCEPSFYNQSPLKHGVNMTRGGFRSLLEELRFGIKDLDVIEGDCTKWDSGMLDMLFEAILHVRFSCWDKKGMTPEEWWARARYAYSQIKESFIALTTGQVIQKMFGNPSGQTSTTDDNCIGHLFVLCLMWRRLYKRSLYADHGRRVNMAIYADDHVICAEAELNLKPYERRATEYARAGCSLAKDKDFTSKDFEGHTFLGLTARWSKQYNCYVPYFSKTRAFCSLAQYEKIYTIKQVFDRASVLLLLTSFDDECFEVIRNFMKELKTRYAGMLLGRRTPTIGICRAFWLCREVGGSDGDKNLDSCVKEWLPKILKSERFCPPRQN